MTPRSAFVITLWCLALLMQSIGLLHSYVHPHGGHDVRFALACQTGGTQSPEQAACLGSSGHGHAERTVSEPAHPDWLHKLFAGHDSGGAGCSLFDQLTHADLLHQLPSLPSACTAPVQPDVVHASWHHARQATGFLARAPPAIG